MKRKATTPSGLHRAYHGQPGVLEGTINNRSVCIERKVMPADLRRLAKLFHGRTIPAVTWDAWVSGRCIGFFPRRRDAIAAVNARLTMKPRRQMKAAA
jgi:hypothetical protein